jgi:3-deoxy-manno-octulosonate cytidylyltransferase (CMP-KDO synthetase)
MESVVVIPARLESTRLPRKIMADIAGKPMLRHVCEQASRARLPREVYVATDSQEVAEAVEQWGFRAVVTASDIPSGTARIASIVGTLDSDIIVDVQSDEPMIDPGLIDAIVEAFDGTEADVVTPVFAIESLADLHDPGLVKAVRGHRGRALYFSRSPIPHVRDVEPSQWLDRATFWGHIGVYGFRRSVLDGYNSLREGLLENVERLEQLRLLEAGLEIDTIVSKHRPIGVDTFEDLVRVRAMMETRTSP